MKDLSARFYDLEAQQFADGTIRLTQMDYAGEAAVIDLNPAQLKHLAEQIGVIEPAQIPRNVERQIWRMYEKAGELSDYLNGVPSFPPQSRASPDQEMADDLFDGLENILDDLGLMPLDAEPEQDPADPPKQSKFHPEQPPKQYQQGDLLGDAS